MAKLILAVTLFTWPSKNNEEVLNAWLMNEQFVKSKLHMTNATLTSINAYSFHLRKTGTGCSQQCDKTVIYELQIIIWEDPSGVIPWFLPDHFPLHWANTSLWGPRLSLQFGTSAINNTLVICICKSACQFGDMTPSQVKVQMTLTGTIKMGVILPTCHTSAKLFIDFAGKFFLHTTSCASTLGFSTISGINWLILVCL